MRLIYSHTEPANEEIHWHIFNLTIIYDWFWHRWSVCLP